MIRREKFKVGDLVRCSPRHLDWFVHHYNKEPHFSNSLGIVIRVNTWRYWDYEVLWSSKNHNCIDHHRELVLEKAT